MSLRLRYEIKKDVGDVGVWFVKSKRIQGVYP